LSSVRVLLKEHIAGGRQPLLSLVEDKIFGTCGISSSVLVLDVFFVEIHTVLKRILLLNAFF